MASLINCLPVAAGTYTATNSVAVGSSATITLYIEPKSAGYVVSADQFQYYHNSNNDSIIDNSPVIQGTNTSSAYAVGNKVRFILDLVDAYTITSNVNVEVDLGGEATDKKLIPYTAAGTWDQALTNCTASPITGASGNAYSVTATQLNEELVIINQTFTASADNYFATTPTFVKTSVGAYADNYLVEASNHVYTSGFLTAITYTITWKNPGVAVSGHNLDFVATAVVIPVAADLISAILIDDTTILTTGATRTLRIYGTPGASTRLFIRNDGSPDTWYNFTTDEFTGTSESYSDNIEIPPDGIYETDIVFPVQNVTPLESYIFSVIGGSSPATNTTQGSITNNDAFTKTLYQRANVTITTTGTGTGITAVPTNNVLTVPYGIDVNVDQYGNIIDGQALSMSVTRDAGGNITLRRQPIFSYDVAYDTAGNNDFSNTLFASNNGSEWENIGLAATGGGTATVIIATKADGYGARSGGTANVTSVLNIDNIINQPCTAANANYAAVEDVTLNEDLAGEVTNPHSDTLVYSLVSDNTGGNGALGTINSSTGAFEFVPTANYNGTVTFTWRVQDSLGEYSNTATASIVVAAVADPVTDIALSADTQAENTAVDTVIGAFSSTDADGSGTYTYTLVSGTGDTHNAHFNISGANLRNEVVHDYEALGATRTIRVRSTDADGSTPFEKAFTINITNVNEGYYTGCGSTNVGGGASSFVIIANAPTSGTPPLVVSPQLLSHTDAANGVPAGTTITGKYRFFGNFDTNPNVDDHAISITRLSATWITITGYDVQPDSITLVAGTTSSYVEGDITFDINTELTSSTTSTNLGFTGTDTLDH